MRENIPVKKNESCIMEIDSMGHEGEGVGRVQGFTVFVEGALPGEKVEVRIVKVAKAHAFGKLLNILTPSPDRVNPFCKVYNSCGGCSLQHLDYDAQLKHKTDRVKQSIERIGKLKGVTVHDTIGMQEPMRYRNKAQYPVGMQHAAGIPYLDGMKDDKRIKYDEIKYKGIKYKGIKYKGIKYDESITADSLQPVMGFFAKRSHDIIDTCECHIQHDTSELAAKAVRESLTNRNIDLYDEQTGKGTLRHVVTRIGYRTGEVMVILVTNGRKLPYKDEFVSSLRRNVTGLKSVVQNINEKQTNVVMGPENIVLFGSGTITDYIGEFKFNISPLSFFQVNPVQTEVLYNKALEYAGLTGNETVFDLYCGIGAISLFLSKGARKVYGVEVVAEAVADARANAVLNGVSNVEFLVGETEKVIPELYERGIKAGVVVVDPPRKGCDETLLETLVEMKPERIVYVSCNPATLARDLGYLDGKGYGVVEEVQPVDMFPWTHHVESIVLLQQRNN